MVIFKIISISVCIGFFIGYKLGQRSANDEWQEKFERYQEAVRRQYTMMSAIDGVWNRINSK